MHSWQQPNDKPYRKGIVRNSYIAGVACLALLGCWLAYIVGNYDHNWHQPLTNGEIAIAVLISLVLMACALWFIIVTAGDWQRKKLNQLAHMPFQAPKSD